MHQFISGALVMGYAIATLFFLRFWRESGDRLFGLFALSFGILGLQRFALAATTEMFEDTTVLYAIRLAAFLIILFAIIDKNRSPSA